MTKGWRCWCNTPNFVKCSGKLPPPAPCGGAAAGFSSWLEPPEAALLKKPYSCSRLDFLSTSGGAGWAGPAALLPGLLFLLVFLASLLRILYPALYFLHLLPIRRGAGWDGAGAVLPGFPLLLSVLKSELLASLGAVQATSSSSAGTKGWLGRCWRSFVMCIAVGRRSQAVWCALSNREVTSRSLAIHK